MTAKQMFKEIGYELIEYTPNKIEYVFRGFIETIISFDIEEKIYHVSTLGRASAISPNIHKTITQQMKELGWLDD